MADNSCTDNVIKALLSNDEEVKFSRDELENIEKQLKNQQENMNAEMLGKEATRLGLEVQRVALIKKQGLVAQAQHVAEKLAVIKNIWSDGPGFGLESLIVGVNSSRFGARESTGAHQRAFRADVVGAWRSDIEHISHVVNGQKINAFKRFKSGELDSDIFEALFRLERELPEEVIGLDELSVKIARTLMKSNNRIFVLKNEIPGVDVRQLFGYVMRNNSDMHRVRTAVETLRGKGLLSRTARAITGKIDSDKDTNFQAWFDFTMPLLNHDRTFGPGLDDDDIEAFMRKVWKEYSNGGHMTYVPDSASSNIARQMSASRIMHWADGRSANDYNKVFGSGNLMSSFFVGLERNANAIMLMREWGPNPRAAYNQTLLALTEEHGKDGLRGVKKGVSSMGEARLDNDFSIIDGATSIPGNAVWAEIGATARAIQTLSKLGSAGLSAVADPVFMASTKRFLGEGMFEAQWNTLNSIFGNDGLPPELRRQTLNVLSIMNDSQRGQAMAGATVDSTPGVAAKLMEHLFDYNGLNYLTNRFRIATNLGFAAHLGNFAGKSYSELTPELQRSLGQHGIGKAEWTEVVSKASITEGEHSVIVPERIRSVDNASFARLASKRLAAVSKAFDEKVAEVDKSLKVRQVDAAERGEKFDVIVEAGKARDEIERLRKAKETRRRRVIRDQARKIDDKLRGWFSDLTDQSVVTPDARTRSILTQGLPAGTASGEAIRAVMQFKSFPVAVYQQVIGRELFGRGDDLAGFFFTNNMIKNGGAGALVYNTITSAFYGYIALTLKDMSKGRMPRNPAEMPKSVLAASLLQGGGSGILGDFLFGELKDRYGRGFAGSILGPTASSVSDLANLTGRFFNGDPLLATAFSDIINHVPFNNVFYIRMAIDYLILFNLREMMNPGFLSRMERRIERENAQEFFIPPSSYIPRGGTNPFEVPGELAGELPAALENILE